LVNSSDSLKGISKPVSKYAFRVTGCVPQLGPDATGAVVAAGGFVGAGRLVGTGAFVGAGALVGAGAAVGAEVGTVPAQLTTIKTSMASRTIENILVFIFFLLLLRSVELEPKDK
jgi:hypothetical protein